ncbi:hypothetical protein PITC_080930 [Penicillium italicum]|uniref:Uncharacterized protein n=1 Tax=Penicillium italicum TaxID=40296 RepID=A0A0A2L5M1_PENIT|nr:hypothetical protein PITC_080930 [Penicillium italicum]
MRDKSSRADSNIADGNRNGWYPWPPLTSWTWNWAWAPFPAKTRNPVLGRNAHHLVGMLWNGPRRPPPDPSEKFSLVEKEEVKQFVRCEVLYDGNMI